MSSYPHPCLPSAWEKMGTVLKPQGLGEGDYVQNFTCVAQPLNNEKWRLWYSVNSLGTCKIGIAEGVPGRPMIRHLAVLNEGEPQDAPLASLLKRLKVLCSEYKFKNLKKYKLHSFRHHFASMCANHGVAHRKALAWLGHSNSDMLDIYYHLHDEDSQRTMMELARSDNSESGNNGPEDSEQQSSLKYTTISNTCSQCLFAENCTTYPKNLKSMIMQPKCTIDKKLRK